MSFGVLFPPTPTYYGSYSSTTTQNVTATEPLALVHDTEDIHPSGVYASLPSADLYVRNRGVYKILTSIQVNKTSGGFDDVEMYISINGTPVPNTATRLNVNQNVESLMTVEWFVQLNANDYINIVIYSASSGFQALAIASATPVPAVPSVITTIFRISSNFRPTPTPTPVPVPPAPL